MKKSNEILSTGRQGYFGMVKCLGAVVCALAFVGLLLVALPVADGASLKALAAAGSMEPSVPVAWAASLMATPTATVRIQPVNSVEGVGSTFTVDVMIDDASDLGAYEFDMTFYTPTVHVDGVADASFLGSTGRTVVPLTPTIDNEIGLLSFGAFSYNEIITGPNGTGALATITLTAQSVGTTTLGLQNVQVVDTQGVTQPVSVEDGMVTVVQPFTTWYLAEGWTGGDFVTVILIANPNPDPAIVDVTYYVEGGSPIVRQHTVPANARYTINAGKAGQVGPGKGFSTKLESDQPIVVERAMYWGNYNGGHDTIGVSEP